jgi:hypothetical protein
MSGCSEKSKADGEVKPQPAFTFLRKVASAHQLFYTPPERKLPLGFPELALRVDRRVFEELVDALPADAVAACQLTDVHVVLKSDQDECSALIRG